MKRTSILILLLALSLLLSSCIAAATQALCDPGIRLVVEGLELTSGLSILEYAQVNFDAPNLRANVADINGIPHCQLRFYVNEFENNWVMAIQVNMESGRIMGINEEGRMMVEELNEVFIQILE